MKIFLLGKGAWMVRLTLLGVFLGKSDWACAGYVGSVSVVTPNSAIQTAGTEILGSGGGAGVFTYKGGGNAVDAAVAAALSACVIDPSDCSLGGYGGHMIIWKAGLDGDPQLLTCIDFGTAAGSLASSNMFAGSVDPTTGNWTAGGQAANLYGWKAAGVPGTFGGLFMAQTNYGRKISGTNFFPFAEILKPVLARVANGQAVGNAYYTLSSVSNLLMDLYTNSPGYLDGNGQPNPNSANNPYKVFYAGDIAQDIATAMQTYGGQVTYADMTNYRPREVQPYLRHFSPPNGTPAWVATAPLGASGISVLQELGMMEALGWTNGPNGTWDSLHYWHSRAEVARLMWKDHFQWLGDPGGGILPPDFLRNGSTNFSDQMLAHSTNGEPFACPWDPNETRVTNSLAASITAAVNGETNVPILVHWNDIRYGTCNISTSDQWGNCVAVTFSMGGGYGAQVGVTNRRLVFGQGIALFDPRPGWPNSIAPGKRPVDNMCPTIVIPDYPASGTNGSVGGRPPFAVGGVGGSTIENNMSGEVLKYLTDSPSSGVTDPTTWMYNFEANTIIYMQSSYPTGVQSYLPTVGLSAPGGPPSVGQISHVEAWVAPVIVTQPSSTNVTSGSTVTLSVAATGLPLFYQWLQNGSALSDGGTVSGSQTPRLTLSALSSGASYSVMITNGAATVVGAAAGVSVDGAAAIVTPPASRTNLAGTLATFSVSAIGNAPLAYQWLKDATPLANRGNASGATGTTLSLSNVSAADVASYAVIVTNLSGSVTSSPATLTLGQANSPSPLFLYEPFDYANIGGPVSSNTPANWTYGGSGANDLSVVSGNLSYPGLAVAIGNSVTNGGNGLGVRRLFGTNFNTGKIYFSALFRINDLGFGAWNGQASVLGSLTATDNTSFRLQVVVKSNSPSGFVIGTQKSGTGVTTTFDTTERHAGDTMFVVGKYDFTVTPNIATLWINPNSAALGAATEPSTNLITATTGTDGFTIDRFNMRQNAASGSFSVPASIQWDELRFGFSWADVTPAQPATLVKLINFAKLANGSVQFSYSNSDGRTYNVFASTNLANWTSLGTATQIAPGSFQFTDTNAMNLARRFYQLRWP